MLPRHSGERHGITLEEVFSTGHLVTLRVKLCFFPENNAKVMFFLNQIERKKEGALFKTLILKLTTLVHLMAGCGAPVPLQDRVTS